MKLLEAIEQLEKEGLKWTRPAQARQDSQTIALELILELLAANESLRHELELERRRHGNC